MNAQGNEKGPDSQAETFRHMMAQHMVSLASINPFNNIMRIKKTNFRTLE